MTNDNTPGTDLLLRVRAGFVRQGTSYSKWLRSQRLLRSSASQALIGAWDGPKARVLRARILSAAGVSAPLAAARKAAA